MKKNISRAQAFAREKHAGISVPTISGYNDPQLHHIQEVVDLVFASGGTEEEIVAAWLHDTVEDTDTTIKDIERMFGGNVAEIVSGMTDPNHFQPLSSFERKKMQAERLRDKSDSVKRIKLADQISNVIAFAFDDPLDRMTKEERHDYIRGAKLVADECRSVSPFLYNLFQETYKQALEGHKNFV